MKVAEGGARGAGRRCAMLLREGLGLARVGAGAGPALRPGGGARARRAGGSRCNTCTSSTLDKEPITVAIAKVK